MRLELTARHFTLTAALRKLVEQRLTRASRPLNHSVVSAQVVITREKSRFQAEVTLHARGDHFLHGEGTGRDAQTALSAAIDRIDRQLEKLKGKWTEGKRRAISPAKAASAAPRPRRGAAMFGTGLAQREPDASDQVRIIRARRYAVKPMSVDEAAMEVGDSRDSFVVFRNDANEQVNVLFRRPDGNLGLIEPEG
jgi:putative sigma-54 modulation protein